MTFSVLVLCQIRAGANDVCDTSNIFVAKLATWSFFGLANAILHWISSNSLFLCSTQETFSIPFQLLFPQPLPLFPFIVAFCFPHKVSISTFSFRSFNRFSFFSFLLTLAMYFSKLSSVAAVLTRAYVLCVTYFVLHTAILLLDKVLDTYQTSSSIFSWFVESVYTWSWVESPIYDDEVPSLSIVLLKFFLSTLYYSSSMSDCWDSWNNSL